MAAIGIITDSFAQFSTPDLLSLVGVEVVPFQVSFAGRLKADLDALPATSAVDAAPALLPPSEQDYLAAFTRISARVDEVLVLSSSSNLSKSHANAARAIRSFTGRLRFTHIDSQNIGAAQGLLVEDSIRAIQSGARPSEIERRIRARLPHVYSLFSTPGLSYLHCAGLLDAAQAAVAEALNFLPIFTLEEGLLTPIEKVRNQRGIMEFFEEFVFEFDQLQHIVLTQNITTPANDVRQMREHVYESFPRTPFTEIPISMEMAALFGPKMSGLVIQETLNLD